MLHATQEIPRMGRERAVEATAWFSVLMHGAQSKNRETAVEAKAELQRFGVEVKCAPPEGRRTDGRRR